MAEIIDGKALSLKMRGEIKRQVGIFEKQKGRKIGLAVVLVGDDGASQIYVRNKIKACEEVGIQSFSYRLEENIGESELETLMLKLVADDNIDGILVQLPLPKHLNAEKILKMIHAEKDVDGFCDENMGKLFRGEQCLVACTPNGVMKMLEAYGVQISGKNAVVVGRSNIVGKPMAALLLNADATVTVCHSKTRNLKQICAEADILVAAIGKAKFITADMVKDGATVIDVGMNRDEYSKLCGDVDFENVKEKCAYITPVPGGVGPMTITMLMYNTLKAAEARN